MSVLWLNGLSPRRYALRVFLVDMVPELVKVNAQNVLLENLKLILVLHGVMIVELVITLIFLYKKNVESVLQENSQMIPVLVCAGIVHLVLLSLVLVD